ncbi:carboxypeptidase-like regulatory domain-containing protein [Blastopirellula sp. JC732]|uniref:Carboxypeptidase-like regulatory domain-containing protein n=1 Tax=Blastopirellula sediminis TaxID=2894196 RepID=A0A9X1SGQ6_9BACT|nr:carboxypeptidase-like regulatory domain-containing protein [Blastopirellula sediminis]MCC9607475.1 carboxypeptidase-like regulatory domain-containing protein [Blastopirellula sediminis]MCC9629232.1 carboxypeptidase-like regulatory domain-containing protein [Blastopirellula sediminis]
MNSFSNRHFLSAMQKGGVVALLICGAIGCGHTPRSGMTRGDVQVVVKSGETPLDGAQIDLSNPENGEAYGGTIDAAGIVHVDDVAIGHYIVTLLPPDGTPPVPGLETTPAPKANWKLHRQFQRPETTPLRAEVIEGLNKFEFDVESFPAPKRR